MRRAADAVPAFQVVTQDDPRFPAKVPGVVDDRALDHSWLNNIEATPTLIRFQGGREAGRIVGCDSDASRRLTAIRELGEGMPAFQPGCGSLSLEPGVGERLEAKHKGGTLWSRK